ncbi:phosphatase PAP2 family protein [Vibrio agarivorans]|uniref:undecaprenyl-diphosphate phosphatase n=1 Tax=Vibrio agarivorans TaxID=153622 RepID=A0ABT7XZ74_9VIBR|nr:phosphatase PAP2 family protein [Vibrio agarivorans]MDN2480844.1 phosphatase PAP2 family protein [Vibrio agarivorans]
MKLKTLTALIGLSVASAVSANNAINTSVNDDYVVAGDYLQILVPATGLFAAWLHDDPQGAKQLALSVGATQAIVHGAKNVVGRVRPNGNSTMSFPSGHTAAAFSGAAFLQSRYGSAWGIPAYAAASFVGLSRMHGNRHYADDVLAAAGISFLVNQYLISPFQSENMAFTAAPTKDGISFGVSLANDFFAKQSSREYQRRTSGPQPHRLELDIGFNTSDSLKKAGLPGDNLVDEHQPFSSINYFYEFDDGNFIELNLSPNETRKYGQIDQGFSYGGQEYEKDEDVYLAFRQWQVGGTYNWLFPINDKLNTSLGLGASGYLLEFDIDKNDGGKHAYESHLKFMPTVNGHVDYALTDDIHAFAHAQYQQVKRDKVFLAEAGINYELNKEWDIGLKYQYQDSEWKSLQMDYNTRSVVLSVANRF